MRRRARTPGRGATAARAGLVLASFLLAGCAALGLGGGRERADEVVAEAVRLSAEGSTRDAVALVERELGAERDPDVAFLRAFTLGWLHEELPRQRGEEQARAEHLRRAEGFYREALALRPGQPDASINLALLLRGLGRDELLRGGPGARERCEARLREALAVLESVPEAQETAAATYRRRVALGDLWRDLAEAGEPLDLAHLETARAAYRSALALDVDDDLAPLRIVAASELEAERAGGHAWEDPLEAACDDFAERAPRAARRGWELLARHAVGVNDDAHGARARRALERWLRSEAGAYTFSAESLERLPPDDAWGADAELLRELEHLAEAPDDAAELALWNERFPPLEEGTELDASEAARRADALRRRHVLALLLQSLAAVRAVSGDAARAAGLYAVALGVAPEVVAYREDGPLAGERLVGLDVALDQLLLLQAHAEVADPDGERLASLLAEPFFARGTLPDVERLDPEGFLRLHTVLGLILAERGAWGGDDPWDDPWRSAPPHLREARRAALGDPAVKRGEHAQPLPELAALLGEGLEADERRRHQALEAYLDAALGYHDLGDEALARESFARAELLAGSLAEDDARDVAHVRDALGLRRGGFLPSGWVTPGWYVGAGAAWSFHTEDDGDIVGDLAALGYTSAAADFDGDDLGGRIVVGYQFERPVALEVGYLAMGEAESSIDAAGVTNLAQLASDIEDVHPFLADGFTFAARANLWGSGPLTITGRLGAWAWDGTKEVLVNSNLGPATARASESGYDLFFGAGALIGDWRGFHGTLDYERFYLDGDPVDVLSVGLQYSLGK